MRSLIRQSERVSVSFDEGRQSFLTVLIDVFEDEGYLTFDIGGSEETNRAFLKAERCVFVGVVEGIRIQFSAHAGTQENNQWRSRSLPSPCPGVFFACSVERPFAFSYPQPSRIYAESAGVLHEEVALPLYDISVGGIGIQVAEPLAFEPMATTRELLD